MTKTIEKQAKPNTILSFAYGIGIGGCILIIFAGIKYVLFHEQYQGKTYPNVLIDDIASGGKTPQEVRDYWLSQNVPFEKAVIEFKFEDVIATVSGTDLALGYDATLSAAQAYSIGRSGNWLSDTLNIFFQKEIRLTPYFRWKTGIIDTVFADLSARIDVPPQDALFTYEKGRVTAFRVSKNGRAVNLPEAIRRFETAVSALPKAPVYHLVITVPVDIQSPQITTGNINDFGIIEHLATGYSEFHDSIPGRIHNVALAASRINGVLISPGSTFSFNETLGDISAATGYQSAYIIKNGRTVLGDGGGVCQVSTTIFRTALNAGLPIVERHAHAYRVHYYEEAGFKAGLDASVFSPSVDLKFTNTTPAHILIQATTDTTNKTLAIDFYGTSDGRVSEISNHFVSGQTPPPPPAYQEDPTLAPGQIKQVDWAAWGAKASFAYKVTKGNEILQDTVFHSNYRPWQAVYLKGPNTPTP